MSSELVYDLSDTLLGSAAGISEPGNGSLSDVLFGILSIPSVLTYTLSEVIAGFGS